MSNQASTVFKIGDVVSLKVQPEFRGVIEMFLQKTNNSYTGSIEGPLDTQKSSHAWVSISFLDAEYKTQHIIVPILHLAFPS